MMEYLLLMVVLAGIATTIGRVINPPQPAPVRVRKDRRL